MSSQNPFSSPQTATNFKVPAPGGGSTVFGGTLWRSGDCLVVAHQTKLPDRCVKCNTPAVYKKKMKLSWHNPLVYAGLLLGLLPYILMAIALQKRMNVAVGLCPDHIRKRRNAILLGVLGCFAGLGVLVLGIAWENAWIALGGPLMIVVALVYLTIGPRIVWPQKITREHAWIKGVSPEYLDGLPELPLT